MKISPNTTAKTPVFSGGQKSLRQVIKDYPREYGVAVYSGYHPIPDDPDFNLAKRLGRAIGSTLKNGVKLFAVTGGGERTTNMGATAQGAIEAGSKALGIAIPFPNWTPPEKEYTGFVNHPNFMLRLFGEAGFEHASAYTVALPGGAGTAWELLTKAQDLYFNHTLFPSQKQIVLVDHNKMFSGPNRLMPYLKQMVKDKMLKPEFLKIFTLVKTPEEVPAKLMDESIPWTTPRHAEPQVVDTRKIRYKV